MKKKLVVYTAIIGDNYDQLLQPLAIREDVDYVCFVKKGTNGPNKNGIWFIREIDFEHNDNTRVARYAKMHPHILFPDYEYSLWIDGNIQIVDDAVYSIIDNKICKNVLLSSMSHPYVDCCYDDAYICIADHRDKAWRIIAQIVYLKLHGFPKNFGLYETNVLYRNHSSDQIIKFNTLWWKLLSHLSRRDQLGCTYAMWKNDIPMDYFLPKGKNARNTDVIHYYAHNKKRNSKKKSRLRIYIYNFLKKALGYRKNYE